MASKPAQVQLEQLAQGAPAGVDTDQAADHGAQRRSGRRTGSSWTAGRLTLTSRHLSFVPSTATPGVPALTIDLAEIVAVEPGPGRIHRSVRFRTPSFTLHARVTGVATFTRRVVTSIEVDRKRGTDASGLPRPVLGQTSPDQT